MRVAIVGGGVNGVCTAWKLAAKGHDVVLFESKELLAQTSSSSSKLLHGGIRYLENFEFRLVKEALYERSWWLKHVPQHTTPLKICLPIYDDSSRPAWKVKLGLVLYDYLAGSYNIGCHQIVSRADVGLDFPMLKQESLKCVYTFFDGQMDEDQLGAWIVGQAKGAGATLKTGTKVDSIDVDGSVYIAGEKLCFDKVVNLAGPWSDKLLQDSGIASKYRLDLVRGSHLVLDKCIDSACLLEVPNERRVFFVLPYKGKTLVGTTEVRQSLDEDISCSDEEMSYLISAYNHYFVQGICKSDVVDTFAGVRPLIKSAKDPRKATREYAIERQGCVLSVFGGKWTTARALAAKIVKEVEHGFH